jgi:hypothetical protein
MVRQITPRYGPLTVELLYPKNDRKGILMHKFLTDLIRPLSKTYKINFAASDEEKDISLPKLYIDEQLCNVGYMQFPELSSLLDGAVRRKEAMVTERVLYFENMKRVFKWWLVYASPEFKNRRTEILVPSKNVDVGVKNLRVDIRIRRDGLPNTKPVVDSIFQRYQDIFDFRDEDTITMEKYVMTRMGLQQVW